MNRRLLLVLLLVIIGVGAVVAFVLLGGQTGTTPAQQGGVETGDNNQQVRVQQTPLPTPTPITFVELVIAVQEIPRGVRIEPNAVAVIEWPEAGAPNFGFEGEAGLEAVIGQIARTDIFREQPILQNMVTEDPSTLANIGSDAAAILPPNRVAVALPMDRITSVAYAIQPGDYVDIIVSMLFVDVDQTFQSKEPNAFNLISVTETEGGGIRISTDGNAIRGTFDTRIIPGVGGTQLAWPVLIGPSEEPRPRLASQRTVQDAQVIYVGDFPRDGVIFGTPTPAPTPVTTPAPAAAQQRTNQDVEPTPVPPRPDIITLAVSPQDAVVLTWIVEAGLPITFALRSAASTSQVTTDPVTLDYIMNRFNIQVPEKFTYAIEPAIRSIRELSAGNRIQLNSAAGN